MSILDDLTLMYSRGVFKAHIKQIKFPQFKNLQADSVINFNFPVTVLVGQNGSGKSSCLYALQACPDNYSVTDFWFSTELDPMAEEIEGRRPSFCYDYVDSRNREHKQVFYMRTIRGGDPDYWETARPAIKYGLSPQKKRTPPIKKNVVYIDFRAILSSFDKYSYFLERSHKRKTKKNDFLRSAARKINNVMRKKRDYKVAPYSNRHELSKGDLALINRILSKDYTNCTILKHKFHKELGESIKFTSKLKGQYSDAFAGSGEVATVHIVKEISSAKNYSLIILDEPEVSLHPGAQEKLMEFLLNSAKKKKLQIVMSTHSPFMVNKLPKEAIKVFRNAPDGSFEITENCSAENAFAEIGYNDYDKNIIWVEDWLCHSIVQRCLIKNKKVDEFIAKFSPGGCGDMRNSITHLHKMGLLEKHFFLFDGDEYPSYEIKDSSQVTDGEIHDYYKNLNVKIIKDSKDPGIDKIKEVINFMASNQVSYLPVDTPEIIIWDKSVAEDLLHAVQDSQTAKAHAAQIDSLSDYKERYAQLAEITTGDSTSPSVRQIQATFITSWLKKEDSVYKFISDWIEEIG
ncbi:MAG: ATP-binding protein [Alphaproteobacteria bacterium]|nr:ATP-binding protein [Alphaproteobacteria bacterium]